MKLRGTVSYLLDVVVAQGAAILKLLTSEDKTLLIRGDTLLVLDLGLDVVDGVARLDVEGNGLTRQGLDETVIRAWSVSSFSSCFRCVRCWTVFDRWFGVPGTGGTYICTAETRKKRHVSLRFTGHASRLDNGLWSVGRGDVNFTISRLAKVERSARDQGLGQSGRVGASPQSP
ncbi:hypothetical protein BO78DRAFT_154725 [Aspergillus sclerotiicarbonarius CBS 121057]|uniref:Uncharacterized protein n=1 Tax=Aspergillus sclerotiicarbonarius (strain CBS 121057 / IBT 28362) TaxID=1448318 RepID=A0A319FEH5_ASPSB|nr:hypothetical protein BO78DRAFT_154725 [Aspergillus sclerotiicarbonarius CBS 121057]